MSARPIPLRRFKITSSDRPTPIRLPFPPNMLTPPDLKTADHVVLRISGDVGEAHSIAKIQDHEQRQADADQIAFSPEYADPSQQHRCYDVEFETVRRISAHRSQPRSI